MNTQRYKIRPTLRGLYFILFASLLLMAAFNTGENLFYLSTYALFAVILVGFWTTRKSVRNINIQCTSPEAVHRKESFAYQATLEYSRKRGATGSIKLESESFDHPYAIDTLSADTPIQTRMYATMNQRGVHKLPSIKISSSYPFGLFTQHTTLEDENTILVYPRVYPLAKSIMRELDDNGHTPKSSNNNDGIEFYSLREYIPGDDIRRISWKISARIGNLIIRELEPSTTRMVILILDTRGIPKTQEETEQFEQVIDLGASLAVYLLDQQFSVGFVTPNSSIALSKGRHQSTQILEELTILSPSANEEYDDNWYVEKVHNSEAIKVHLATDSTRWGMEIPQSRTRTLDPTEVMHHG